MENEYLMRKALKYELIKLEELTDVEIKDRSDAEFAISVILENL